jgi:C-terminal processing protease CtpA/Prc
MHLRIPIIAAVVLALAAACCCTSLPDSPMATERPTRTRSPAPTLTPNPTRTPRPTAEVTVSTASPNEPYLISGDIPYTSPFFTQGLADSFVLLEDQAGFVDRDWEFEFPLESQVIGPVEVDKDERVTYRLLLPAVPQGTFVDVDNDSESDIGVQVFAVAYWPNVWGDTFLEERDGTGWSSAHASTITDPAREYEISGGILIVWAPDDQQEFPTGFGDDEMLFTEDDPTAPIPAGYNLVNLDETPFDVYKEAHPKIDLYEGASEVNDFSEMEYGEAFESLVDLMEREYAFSEEKSIDWDALRDEYVPLAYEARNATEFYIVVRNLTWAIPDGHIGVGGGPMVNVFFAEQGGGFGLILRELSDGRVIVADVLPDLPAEDARIQVGAEIVSWNGVDVSEAIDDVVPYFSPYSTEHTRRIEQVLFLTRVPAGEEVTVSFRNPGAGTTRVTMVAETEVDSLLAAWSTGDELALPIEGEVLDESGLGYIKISTFLGNYKLMTDLWAHYIEQMIDNNVPGLIIDMRFNSGGSSNLANDFAGYFFDEEITVSYWWDYSSLTAEFERWPIPERIEPGPMYYDDPVIVLVGPDCVSACEGFTYNMTQQGRALVVGHYPSAGAYGGVGRGQVWLPDELELQFPTTRSTTPDGEVIIEGVGIVPDVTVPVTVDSALGEEDAVLNRAVELLTE